MRIGSRKIVVDTYAWIEYFGGTRKGKVVKEYLLNSTSIYTPSIVLAEVARKYIREGVSMEVVRERLRIIAEISAITYIDTEVALEASLAYLELVEHAKKLGLKHKPSLFDAIVLATARRLGAKVLTGDEHFKNLEETIWIGD